MQFQPVRQKSKFARKLSTGKSVSGKGFMPNLKKRHLGENILPITFFSQGTLGLNVPSSMMAAIRTMRR